MSCWDVLGIEPTGDTSKIENAYNQQIKFATPEEARELENAMREALGQVGLAPEPRRNEPAVTPDEPVMAPAKLTAFEHQVVREVAIQIRALLNDSGRCNDPGIWKAILTEPPADKPAIRYEIAETVEGQLRPMAKQGGLSPDVAEFLGKWFNWSELAAVRQETDPATSAISSGPARAEGLEQAESGEGQGMGSFWPAVIGWIIGLVVLTSLFSNMTGS